MNSPSSLRVMTVVGTRPEIIRLSCTLQRLDASFHHTLVHTGQNYDHQLSQVFFDELELRAPDRYLGVDTSSLGHVLAGTLIGVEDAIAAVQPDALLVLGDTNSSIAAVMGKRLQVPVYHMEAGNRSFDDNVPEETNRRLIDHVADFNLVYTEHARRNLIAEGLPSRRIMLTGSADGRSAGPTTPPASSNPRSSSASAWSGADTSSSALTDRKTSMSRIGSRRCSKRCAHVEHRVRPIRCWSPPTPGPMPVSTTSTPARWVAIQFHEPFGFLDYVQLQRNAYCVLSDSGTISEESSILGFPAVTLRDAIERPEALETGIIVTSGLESTVVCDAISLVLSQRARGEIPPVPQDYQILNCSQRVVNFIRATVHTHHVWSGIRRSLQTENETMTSS